MNIRVETLYLYFLIAGNFLFFKLSETFGYYGSSVLFKSVADSGILIYYFIELAVTYVIVFYIYTFLSKIKTVNYKSCDKCNDLFFILALILNLLLIPSGIGKAGTSSNMFGFFVNIFPMQFIILIYYISFNKKKLDTLKKVNLLLGSIIIIMRGWSGPVVFLFLIYMFSSIRKINSIFQLFKIFSASIILIFVYQYLNSLKFYVRDGSWNEMSLIESTDYAISRVMAFYNYAFFSDISEKYVELIRDRGTFFYITEYFITLLPKGLLGLDYYRPLDNTFATEFVAPNLDGFENTGFAITLTGLYRLSILLNDVNIIFFPCFIFINFVLTRFLLSFFWNEKAKYFFFLSLMNFVFSGNVREIALLNYSLALFIFINILLANLGKMPSYELRTKT